MTAVLLLQAITSSSAAAPSSESQLELSQLREQFLAVKAAYNAELRQQWHLPDLPAARLQQMVTSTFEAACAALEAEHGSLVETEQDVARVLNHRSGLARLPIGNNNIPASITRHSISR